MRFLGRERRLGFAVDELLGGFAARSAGEAAGHREEQRRRDHQADQLGADPGAAALHGAKEEEDREQQQPEADRLQQAGEDHGAAVFVHRAEDLRFVFTADLGQEGGGENQRHGEEGRQGHRGGPAGLPLEHVFLSVQLRPLSWK